ncbi:cupin domain-containing protein [Puniceicoccus vermicola]|uniref:Cupin domain-containing protein n=1 Tax=Puniceicoccus vermicola TaxID=388746 RepID=A0A7X1AYE8_9BACT|nr:cupin domain-containing protein [Puniceicoccus vermicola]MBC2602204.1 cupin domain-containing protein [Puniceicoccus vermicola]
MLKYSVLLACLASLLHGEESHSVEPAIQKEVLVQSSESWDGQSLPAYPTEEPQISVVRFIIPPNSQLPMHKHPAINAGVLVKGTLTVISETGDEKLLEEGDALIELVNAWHYGRNDGDVPAEIVVVYAGVKGQPLAVLREQK